jgi:sterol desaturase/sphingolipid hydroxylase (fatty acid hydroxylase superfamily)
LYFRDAVLGVFLVLFFAPHYEKLRLALDFSERTFYALTIAIAHSGTFVLFFGGITIFDDVLGWMTPYRFHRKDHEIADASLFSKLHLESFINHCITTPLVAYGLYPATTYFGTPPASSALPDWSYLAVVFCGAHLFNDVGFYWTHRIFHTKALYKTFHKKHHNFRGTVFSSAEYANPVEIVIANQLPTIGLVIGLGCHPLVQAAWLVLRLSQTYEVHSGYAFNKSFFGRIGLANCGAAFHDHHHTVNMGNFGAEHMDWLFGTMDYWVRDGCEEGYWKRHPLGMTPASHDKNK